MSGQAVSEQAPDGADSLVGLVWRRQRRWSLAASARKRAIGRSRTTALLLAMTGAVTGTASAQLANQLPTVSIGLAFVTSVAIGLGTLVARAASRGIVRDWTRLRSISEALKAEVYTYLAGVAPYRDGDRDQVLLNRADKILEPAANLLRYLPDVKADGKALPAVRDVDSYVVLRLDEQVNEYYRPCARTMARRLRWSRRAELALGVAGTVAAASAGVLRIEQASAWIGVITTVTASIAAHAAASRYEHQQLEYERTADQLELLRARRAAGQAGTDDDFVRDCEHVISIQNEGWMAKWNASGGDETQ